ncbi:MAG TPA: hypothetical protein VG709_04900 [Actinomycetota bacterium]|nr:hypothetical protein [Actinomycetota bacterium]
MQQLTEMMAARAGTHASAPYDRVIAVIHEAPEEQLPPLIDQLRQGVADLEKVVEAAPPVAVSDETDGDIAVRPRETEYDDWVRRELGGDSEGPPGFTVL